MSMDDSLELILRLRNRINDAKSALKTIDRGWAAPRAGGYNCHVSIPDNLLPEIKGMLRGHYESVIKDSEKELSKLLKK